MRTMLLLSMLLLTNTVAQAGIYKWFDDAGNVYYGDEPPPEAQVQTLDDITISTVPIREMAPPAKARVVIYTTQRCGYCVRAKQHLAQRGIDYDERDVERSAEHRKEFRALGGNGVPLIRVGDQVMKGYRKSNLDKMLATAGL